MGQERCSSGLQADGIPDKWQVLHSLISCALGCIIIISLIISCHAGAIAVARSHYGSGLGPIVLDEIECAGTESMLHLCPHGGLGNHNCMNTEHASVICQRKWTGHWSICVNGIL